MFNVSISPKAENEIWEHAEFLAKVSPKAAAKLIDLIYSKIFNLDKKANSYPLFYKDYRKLIVGDRYAVFYKIIETDVNVDRVYDMRMYEYNDIVLDNE